MGLRSEKYLHFRQTKRFVRWNTFILLVLIVILQDQCSFSTKRLGKKLAKEVNIEADVVTGVPDSSISAAIGYAEATGIPYELGLIKNRYVGRTFIQPSQNYENKELK